MSPHGFHVFSLASVQRLEIAFQNGRAHQSKRLGGSRDRFAHRSRLLPPLLSRSAESNDFFEIEFGSLQRIALDVMQVHHRNTARAARFIFHHDLDRGTAVNDPGAGALNVRSFAPQTVIRFEKREMARDIRRKILVRVHARGRIRDV